MRNKKIIAVTLAAAMMFGMGAQATSFQTDTTASTEAAVDAVEQSAVPATEGAMAEATVSADETATQPQAETTIGDATATQPQADTTEQSAPETKAVATPTAAAYVTANVTTSPVLLNGSQVYPAGYNISGTNYYKLRDIAMLLDNTGIHFNVGWDDAARCITLYPGDRYLPVGGEMQSNGSSAQTAVLSDATVIVNGSDVSMHAYNIGGYTYYKLRDIGDRLGFGVGWTAITKTIRMDTTVTHLEDDYSVPPVPAPQSGKVDGTLTIMIDPGHGGSDSGAVNSSTGLKEKYVNMNVALYLRRKLEAAGVQVYMTRTGDTFPSLSDRGAMVAQRANKLDLCISVHHNAANGSASGSEIYAQVRDKSSGPSYSIAYSIMDYFIGLGMKNRGVIGRYSSSYPGKDYLYMLRSPASSDVTAILTEFGFIDNASDARFLATDEGQEAEAQAIYSGIMKYYASHAY